MESRKIESPTPMAKEERATLSLLTIEERAERFIALWQMAARLDVAKENVVRDKELARLPIEQKVAMVEQIRELAQKAHTAAGSSKPTRST